MKWLLIVLPLVLCNFAFAQKFWEGEGFNSNWSNPNNWFPAGVPMATDNVIFPTGSSNCTVDISPTVNSIVIQATYTGTITMNTVTIFISGTADNQFLSGIVTGTGTISITSTRAALFNGTDFTANVSITAVLTSSLGIFTGGPGTIFGGAVNISAYGIFLNGSRYERQATFQKTGAPGGSDNIGTGGNRFMGLTTITNSQNFMLATGNTAGDIFDGELRLHIDGTAPGNSLRVAYGPNFHTAFNSNIKVSTGNAAINAGITYFNEVVEEVQNGGISIGVGPLLGNGGTSTLALGATINELTPGSAQAVGEFAYGDLIIRNLTQSDPNTPQSIDVRGPVTPASARRIRFVIQNCIFNGAVTFHASNVFINATTFNNTFTIHKQRGGVSEDSYPYHNGYLFNAWDGGNVYNGTASFNSYNNSTWVMGRLTPDRFNGNVNLFSNQTTSHFRIAEGPGVHQFKGNISVSKNNNTPEVKIHFGMGGGTPQFSGSGPQSITFDRLHTVYEVKFGNLDLKNSDGLYIGLPATILGNLNFQLGILSLNDNNNLTVDSLTFRDNASVSGAKDGSYVDGTVIKKGKAPFIFPLGNNGFYHPLAIDAPSDPASTFSAQYVEADHGHGADSDDVLIETVSDCEYWNLQRLAGTDNPVVTLYWNDASYCHTDYITNPSALQVMRWSGATWNNLDEGGIIGLPSPDGTDGNIRAGSAVPNAGSHILTFGSLDQANMLPITLTSFQVMPNGTSAEVTWETASEFENDFFTVERLHQNEFIALAKIPGAGTSTIPIHYQWLDTKPLPGLSYYRLKQTDFDGNVTYSEVVALQRKHNQTPYPNPVSETLFLDGLGLDDNTRLYIKDLTGRTIYTGEATSTIDFTNFVSGLYHLGVENNGEIEWYSIRKK